jgi:hypothetical protein
MRLVSFLLILPKKFSPAMGWLEFLEMRSSFSDCSSDEVKQ